MTVDELIKELQKLSDEGKGGYNVVDGDYCSDIHISYVDNNGRIIFAT